eukprot:COSAG01_NODE_22006_length_876_cov_1.005148_1_plen_66_part_10
MVEEVHEGIVHILSTGRGGLKIPDFRQTRPDQGGYENAEGLPIAKSTGTASSWARPKGGHTHRKPL